MQKKIYYVVMMALFLVNTTFAKSNLTFELQGVTGDVKSNIEMRLLRAEHQLGDNLSAYQIRKLFIQGKSEVKNGLQPYGYFKSNVRGQLQQQNNQWKAIYLITPGPQLQITNINIGVTGDGANNSIINDYIQKNALQKGNAFSVPVYNNFKTQLFQTAKNQGYIRAYFKNKILVDLKKYTCDIRIELVTGEQFYIGTIEFKTFPYSQSFMQRFISVQPGDVLSSEKLLDLRQRMERSYYFRRAIFRLDFDNTHNNQVPIDAYLYAPNPASYGLGIGYGTLTGVRLSGNMSLRHLGNEGNHLEADAKISSVLTGTSVTYYVPGNDPLTEQWLMGAIYKHFAPRAGTSDSWTFTGGYSKKYDKWQTSTNLSFITEKFQIKIDPPGQTSHLLYPNWKISYLNTDDVTNPQNGLAFNLLLQGASQQVLSTNSFASLQTRIKAMISPFSFGRFILRGDAGVIGVSNLKTFPLSLRFFAGGINSIRGFADSNIGPGKYLGIVSGEYQQRIKGSLYAAIFYDAGSATNHFTGPINRGTGFGIVYDTKIGPIKVYLARAVSKRDKPYSVEFSMGPEFS